MEPEGLFLSYFTGKKQFLFHELKLFYHGIQYTRKYHPYTLGSTSNHENCPFSVKPLITLTCRNSLINPVTYKFYFGILMRVANETGCESHRSMTIKFIGREAP